MINPVNSNNTSFKSGPWYANVITNVTKVDAFGPIVALEGTVDTGRAVQAYKRGGKNEARERMIEDITGGIVWLFGVKSLNALGDKVLNKLYGGTFDVGTDKVLRTPFDNFMKKNASKTFAKNPKTVALVKAVKVLTSIVLADSFIGLVVPKINQKLTKVLTAKEKEAKKDTNNNLSFKGAGGVSAINVFTNAIENTNIGKLISTDAGLISGRIYSARNDNERREIAIRDIGSIYFYLLASNHVAGLLNLIESGKVSRLNPDSANILNEYLLKYIENNGGEVSVDKFKKDVLGNSAKIKLPENIEFESGEISKLNKLFNSKKEPLQVTTVEKLKASGKFSQEIMNRIEEMSKLQPLRRGEAVVTKQQIIDAMNIAEINNPKLLNEIFDKYTKGAHKDEFKYISNDKLYKLKSEMENYVIDLCKNKEKISKHILNKNKNKNLIFSGINFAAGFAVAALFLSTFIPKFQYYVTKKKTGVDAFPGTYDYNNTDKTAN